MAAKARRNNVAFRPHVKTHQSLAVAQWLKEEGVAKITVSSLKMAAYFAQHPQKYTVAFIAFGAEEAGLVGSLHYVNKPIVPLSQTKFVFNMDLMGSGEGGATIVNATVYPEAFKRFTSINTQNKYLPQIKPRGKAANSDHYFFSEKGVPSFFIYLMGDYKHYHMPADSPKNLRLGEYYDKSFLLIRDFIMSFSTG